MYNDTEIKKILGKNLKSERIKNDMSQEELAEKVNLSVQFIRDIEAGRNLGSVTTLLNLCNALNVTPNRIFVELLNIDISNEKNLSEKINSLNERDKELVITLLNKMNEV